MATITLTLTAIIDGTPQTISKSATIDDGLMPSFFQAYRAALGQINGGTEEAPAMRDMTDAETFGAYALGISAGTAANVQGHLRAVAQAAVTVPPVTITPVE